MYTSSKFMFMAEWKVLLVPNTEQINLLYHIQDAPESQFVWSGHEQPLSVPMLLDDSPLGLNSDLFSTTRIEQGDIMVASDGDEQVC